MTEDILQGMLAYEYALFRTFLVTGFRENEVRFLYWEDCDCKNSTIKVRPKPEYDFTGKPVFCHLLISPSSQPIRLCSEFWVVQSRIRIQEIFALLSTGCRAWLQSADTEKGHPSR